MDSDTKLAVAAAQPVGGSQPVQPRRASLRGPMCASVEDVARLLSVIAGHDGWDTRTIAARPGDYMAALGKPAKGLRVGILREGFGHPESDPAVNDKVRQAIEALGIELKDINTGLVDFLAKRGTTFAEEKYDYIVHHQVGTKAANVPLHASRFPL